MDWTEEVDASGLICPLPVLRARKRLSAMAPGSVLRLVTTDPAAVIDVPHFCAEAGHDLLAETAQGGAHIWLIRRGQGAQIPKPE
ncbi:sulfurtransferase TusA family protein [Rhodovulum strictum]|uniref:Sulfurtransferase TusA family protein n=1 Tax=Rhodovulum strictum TaxID=58314 RepID=A0A844BH98_9RHOB|nr:sulfurtransferase TusA family protein [Rhodovulum strictum]MRH21959.1 sulfurtransferase TusA family protein [Rhodovulum strictum]